MENGNNQKWNQPRIEYKLFRIRHALWIMNVTKCTGMLQLFFPIWNNDDKFSFWQAYSKGVQRSTNLVSFYWSKVVSSESCIKTEPVKLIISKASQMTMNPRLKPSWLKWLQGHFLILKWFKRIPDELKLQFWGLQIHFLVTSTSYTYISNVCNNFHNTEAVIFKTQHRWHLQGNVNRLKSFERSPTWS